MRQKKLRKDWPALPTVRWDRAGLLEWRANLPKARRHEDHDNLQELFQRRTRIPVLNNALKWAETHNIDFIVDHTTTVGGYYPPYTGVVAIAKSSLADTSFAAGVLVHEICHARQDFYGLLPTGGKSFTDYYMRLALCEADATAHEELTNRQSDIADDISLAKKQVMLLKEQNAHQWILTKNHLFQDRSNQSMKRATDSADKALWSSFRGWYYTRALTYGTTALRNFSRELGVPGVTAKDYKFEFNPNFCRSKPPRKGIDITSFEGLQKLSRSFNGRHYFNTRDARNFLIMMALSPDEASSFFSYFNQICSKRFKHSPEINEVRRRQLLLKYHSGRDIVI